MPAPIALQLYSVREALALDFAGVVRKIAAMGYAGVETAGFPPGLPGVTPRAAGQLFQELGLAVVAAHAPLPLGEQRQPVIEAMRALRCPRLVCASQPAESFRSADGIRQVCGRLNEAYAAAKADGLAFGYHNHTAEFQAVGECNAFDIFMDQLEPGIFLEVDTYWAQTAGVNPAGLVRRLGPHAPLLHIKDGPCVRGKPQVALGEGEMDILAILQAGAGFAQWAIVELDQCATDMLTAVEKSCRYLGQL